MDMGSRHVVLQREICLQERYVLSLFLGIDDLAQLRDLGVLVSRQTGQLTAVDYVARGDQPPIADVEGCSRGKIAVRCFQVHSDHARAVLAIQVGERIV